MEDFITLFEPVSHFLFIIALGWYLITNLQWHNYQLDRVVFKHTKPSWHAVHFALPVAFYFVAGVYFLWFLYLFYIPFLIYWYAKLDKKLVFTARVYRFFSMLIVATATQDIICFHSDICHKYGVFMPIFATLIASSLSENWLRKRFKMLATEKIERLADLKVLAITASYGKTSLKHFLYEILKTSFKTHSTSGNVNTDLGIAADINKNLDSGYELYIVEAGARNKGDILEIAKIVKPHYSIVGKVGKQHIEYFKTLETIKSTKREMLASNRLIRGVVHESSGVKPNKEVIILKDDQVQNVVATLDGTSWDLVVSDQRVHFETSVLGSFNALNISLAFLMARELGLSDDKILTAIKNLKSVPHRLEKIVTPNKLILDDSYNGNLEGMLSAIDLASTYSGRKVIVTPGLVESDDESNKTLAKRIDEVFDLALITGDLNSQILSDHISHGKRKRVFDKKMLTKMLEIETKAGDLILFANDAPSFV